MMPIKRDRRAWRAVAGAVIICAAVVLTFSACGPKQFKATMFKPNTVGGLGPSGLAWDGESMVLGDRTMIMTVDSIKTGSYKAGDSDHTDDGFYMSVRTPEPLPMDMNVCGLAWEGECCGQGFLWISDSLNGEIVKLNGDNQVVKRLASPGPSPCALAFTNDTLWVADSENSKIYNLSATTGEVLREFDSPVEQPLGLAWDCDALWVTGLNDCGEARPECNAVRLVKLDVQSGTLKREVKLPDALTRPSSLTWADGTLWVGDYTLGRVFAVSDKGRKIKDDPKVYTSAITVKKRRIIVEKMSLEEAEKLRRDEKVGEVEHRRVKAHEAAEADRAAASAEDARRAAEDARRAAEEARSAAEKSEKAFELQLKK